MCPDEHVTECPAGTCRGRKSAAPHPRVRALLTWSPKSLPPHNRRCGCTPTQRVGRPASGAARASGPVGGQVARLGHRGSMSTGESKRESGGWESHENRGKRGGRGKGKRGREGRVRQWIYSPGVSGNGGLPATRPTPTDHALSDRRAHFWSPDPAHHAPCVRRQRTPLPASNRLCRRPPPHPSRSPPHRPRQPQNTPQHPVL